MNKTIFGQLAVLKGHNERVTSVAFSPDGKKIVSGSWDKTIRVWDAETGKEIIPPLEGHSQYVFYVAFSPDEKKIMIKLASDETIICDVNSGSIISRKSGSTHLFSICFIV